MVNPENTFYSVKRFIGRRMDEVDEESKVSCCEAAADARRAREAPSLRHYLLAQGDTSMALLCAQYAGLCPSIAPRLPQRIPFHVIKDAAGNVKIDVPAIKKSFSPEEISAQARACCCASPSSLPPPLPPVVVGYPPEAHPGVLCVRSARSCCRC